MFRFFGKLDEAKKQVPRLRGFGRIRRARTTDGQGGAVIGRQWKCRSRLVALAGEDAPVAGRA